MTFALKYIRNFIAAVLCASIGITALADDNPEISDQTFPSEEVEDRNYRISELGSLSEGKILIYYGEGIKNAGIAASALRNDGFPAIAVRGAREGQIRLIIDGKVVSGDFTDDLLGRSVFSVAVQQEYMERFPDYQRLNGRK